MFDTDEYLALETITLGIFAHTIWPLWMPVFVCFVLF